MHSGSQKAEPDIMVTTLLMQNLRSLRYEIIVHIGTQVRALELTRNNHEIGHFFPTAFPLGLFEEPPVEVLSAGALTSRSWAPSLAALLAALVSLAALMNLVTSCIHIPQHFNKTKTTPFITFFQIGAKFSGVLIKLQSASSKDFLMQGIWKSYLRLGAREPNLMCIKILVLLQRCFELSPCSDKFEHKNLKFHLKPTYHPKPTP